MIIRDIHNNTEDVRAISPVSVGDNTAEVSEIIDMQGNNSLEFIIATGSLAAAAATFAVLIEHGDDSGLSDAAAVTDDMLLGTEAEASFDQADDDTTKRIGYIGDKRYVRMTITPTGNDAAALFGAVAHLGLLSRGELA